MVKFFKVATHITQSPAWAKFRLTTPNVKKVVNFNGVQIYFHRVPLAPFTVAYIPRAYIKITGDLKRLCQKEKAIYLKIEPLSPFDQFDKFVQSRSILPRHTIYVDLTKSEDDLLNDMHEKTRYNIRLAEKKGVMIKENEDIEGFIKLLTRTESRQGFYSHYPNYYRKLWEILKPEKMVYLLSAYLPHEALLAPRSFCKVGARWGPIAAIMLFKYQDVLYYPYGGSDPNFKEYQAPSLLHWEAMKLGKELGCKVYDLWGTYKNSKDESDPWFGIYRFKSGFGGTEIDFPPSFDVPLSPLYLLFKFTDNLRWLFLKKFR